MNVASHSRQQEVTSQRKNLVGNVLGSSTEEPSETHGTAAFQNTAESIYWINCSCKYFYNAVTNNQLCCGNAAGHQASMFSNLMLGLSALSEVTFGVL